MPVQDPADVAGIESTWAAKAAARDMAANGFGPLSEGSGGTLLLEGRFSLQPDEALVVEGRAEGEWRIYVASDCGPAERAPSSDLASDEIEQSDDGTFRVVIAPHDPGRGEANWLNTDGESEGLVVIEGMRSAPACTVVKFAELGGIWGEI